MFSETDLFPHWLATQRILEVVESSGSGGGGGGSSGWAADSDHQCIIIAASVTWQVNRVTCVTGALTETPGYIIKLIHRPTGPL